MKYTLQFMNNKKEEGLERTITVEYEDIPQRGDIVSYKQGGFIEAEVYQVYRDIHGLDKNSSNIFTRHTQDIPTVRALILKNS